MKACLLALALVILVVFSVFKLHSSALRTYVSDLSYPYRFGINRTSNIMVPMRDGVMLRSDLFLPSSEIEKPLSTILIRTTYEGFDSEMSIYFAQRGFAVVQQHVRGRFGSEGGYHIHKYSGRDGVDTLDWIVNQGWSNGKVGTYGCSFRGESQIILAAENHPAHITMIVEGAGGAIGKAKDSYGYFGIFENGVLNFASALGWFTMHGQKLNSSSMPESEQDVDFSMLDNLPLTSLTTEMVDYETLLNDYLRHELSESWWDDQGYISKEDVFSVSGLHVNSWYDQTVHDSVRLFEYMQENTLHARAKDQYLLIGPGDHCQGKDLLTGANQIGEMEYTYQYKNYRQIYLDWFDYWLNDKNIPLPPRVQYFTVHANEWRSSHSWPVQDLSFKHFYLSNDGLLKNILSDNSKQSFIYDPHDPVPSKGGAMCCTGDDASNVSGAVDQTSLQARPDVLYFESDMLDDAIDIFGSVKVQLSVSTNRLDTDFTVKLLDVYPSGEIYNIQDGVSRLRYREGVGQPKLAQQDKIYSIAFDMRPTSYRIKEGHKVGVMISSSNFPRLARNLNTGEDEYSDSSVLIAENTVYWGKEYQSYLSVPIETRD